MLGHKDLLSLVFAVTMFIIGVVMGTLNINP